MYKLYPPKHYRQHEFQNFQQNFYAAHHLWTSFPNIGKLKTTEPHLLTRCTIDLLNTMYSQVFTRSCFHKVHNHSMICRVMFSLQDFSPQVNHSFEANCRYIQFWHPVFAHTCLAGQFSQNQHSLEGQQPQICTVLNFGMTIFNFHFLLLFLANLARNWVIFDEKLERLSLSEQSTVMGSRKIHIEVQVTAYSGWNIAIPFLFWPNVMVGQNKIIF